ncbi:MAG: SgcJ/EcaC family oxidoreductase [Deltaproteobacteria bacterium]|nr:SgcJ/EcaC family oxidoreductase [Deltaproteobacteria bacterium]
MNAYEHTGSEVDLKAIDSVRDAHVAAVNGGDARAWAAQFTDDGVQMPPNMPANVGRPAIEAWSKGFMNLFGLTFDLSVEEVRVLGEWAFEQGTYTIGLNPKSGGPPMQDAGKYITVYQRKSGERWRMARDIWNSSNPAAGQ